MSALVTVLTACGASLVTGIVTVGVALRKRRDDVRDRTDAARATVDAAEVTGRHQVEIERVKADAALQIEAIRLAPNLITEVQRVSRELAECNAKHDQCLTKQEELCARVEELERGAGLASAEPPEPSRPSGR